MTDNKAPVGDNTPLHSVTSKPAKQKNVDENSSSHLFGEMRHSPEMIKELFRTGQYPYKTKIRKAAYEQHKSELQVELLRCRTG